jgi:hypothetical protein
VDYILDDRGRMKVARPLFVAEMRLVDGRDANPFQKIANQRIAILPALRVKAAGEKHDRTGRFVITQNAPGKGALHKIETAHGRAKPIGNRLAFHTLNIAGVDYIII